jgi:hypothetical protein
MPIQPLHREVALIALRATAKFGFALGGGNALIAHGISDRPTQDVDLFTDQEAAVPSAAAAVEDALHAAGFVTERQDTSGGWDDIWDGLNDDLAEWLITGPGGQRMMLQLAYFDRTVTPVTTSPSGIGPVLAVEDVIGGKAAALAVRSYERDYIDIAEILRTRTVDEVIALARQADPALEPADFADAGRHLDQLDDLAFARYGLDRADVARLRGQFAAWPRTAPPRKSGELAAERPSVSPRSPTTFCSPCAPPRPTGVRHDDRFASMTGSEQEDYDSDPGRLDTGTAHIARVYDYWLGGKDHFAADREAGDEAVKAFPGLISSVRANRAFLARTVRYLAGEAGIRQFLDIGTGIPSPDNTHEVAQSVAPGSRVVYVDDDPMVLAHARALLRGDPRGRTAYIDADLRDAGKILSEAATVLDFGRPVAVMLVAVLHLISDADRPADIVRRLMAAVPPGSSLTISHVPSDMRVGEMSAMSDRLNRLLSQPSTYRDRATVTGFFDGLELVPPGVVPIQEWHSTPEEAAAVAAMWGGVALKK